MDIYLKTVAGALVVLVLCLALSKQGKDFGLLLALLGCCMIAAVAVQFLNPVVSFFETLEKLIPLDNALLEVMLKAVGIGMIGEIAAMICADSGNAALGKALQVLTSVLILWLTLPLFEALLDLISGTLEDL